jgi:hypothetical protein
MIQNFASLTKDTLLAECWAFWRSCRHGRPVPLKAYLDPVEMPRRILPHLFLYERTSNGRFRCRLAGTGVCEMFHDEPTGKYLDDLIPPPAQESRLRLFRAVLDQARPIAFEGRLGEPGREWIPFVRLLLPISSDGVATDIVFGMVIFRNPSRFPKLVSPELGSLGAIRFATDDDLAEGEDGLDPRAGQAVVAA